MQEILRLRFLDRDKAFAEILTSLKQDMNAREIFPSTQTVKRGHDALLHELVESRGTILTTISEYLTITNPNKIEATVTENAVEWLRNKKEFLESYYLEQMRAVVSSLQNRKMLDPYLSLSDAIELNEYELRVELAQEIEKYISSCGATLYDRTKNQFLDRPLVVIVMITIAAVTFVLTFLGLMSVFRNIS